MRKYISGILVIAIMIGIFAAFAIGTSAKADAQYDLDDPEQRLAYEMTFLTGSRSMERAKYIVDQDADLTIFSTGKATGVVNVIGDESIVTDIRIFMYIQRYESGKWKTVYNDTQMFAGENEATMIRTCTDSSAIIKGYEYRVSFSVYAYKGMTYQQSTGTSPIVR